MIPALLRKAFRARVSGDPSGAPPWVRDIALVGEGPGWFEPDGVVWRVHGDLSTLVGGVAALMGQATHPLALRGVEEHSTYATDPWGRLAGTARWLVTTTFGSAELAEREALRVRTMHRRVQGPGYAASDPDLLRWVHLVFTDAFLHAQLAVGTDLAPRFGRHWPDTYVADWARSAAALGATDLPVTVAGLDEQLRSYRPVLVGVPRQLRVFLLDPPGLGLPERVFYGQLARAGGMVLHPALADLARSPGRDRALAPVVTGVRLQLSALGSALGGRSPSEAAARYRLGLGPAPAWAA